MTEVRDPADIVRHCARSDPQEEPSRVAESARGGALRIDPDGEALSFVRRDGARFHAGRLAEPRASGPVAVLTDHPRRLAAWMSDLAERGLGTSFGAAVTPGSAEELADWIEVAVRHPMTRLLLLDVPTPEALGPLRDTLSAVAGEQPVFRVDRERDQPDGDLLRSWWQHLGVLSHSRGEPLCAALRLLCGPLPDAGGRWRVVVGPGTEPGRAGATDAEAVVAGAVGEAVEAACSFLRTTAHDLVLLHLPELTEAELEEIAVRLSDPDQARSEVGLLVVLHGSAAQCRRLAERLPPGTGVVEAREAARAVSIGTSWPTEPGGTSRLRALPGPADASRLRRVAMALRRDPGHVAPVEAQREVAAGMGIPLAPSTVVRYVEDAPMAAAALGFPVEISAWAPHVADGMAEAAEIVPDSARLGRIAHDLLSTARRRGGMEAGLLLRPVPVGTPAFTVHVVEHARFGPMVSLEGNGRTWRSVGLPVRSLYGDALAPLDLPPAIRAATEQSLQRGVEAAFVAHDLLRQHLGPEGCRLALSIRPLRLLAGGPLAHDVLLRIDEGGET